MLYAISASVSSEVNDCANIQRLMPGAESGSYSISIAGTNATKSVWCDMATDGGGWTVSTVTDIIRECQGVVYACVDTCCSPRLQSLSDHYSRCGPPF